MSRSAVARFITSEKESCVCNFSSATYTSHHYILDLEFLPLFICPVVSLSFFLRNWCLNCTCTDGVAADIILGNYERKGLQKVSVIKDERG
jgi:hypothetical protein